MPSRTLQGQTATDQSDARTDYTGSRPGQKNVINGTTSSGDRNTAFAGKTAHT